MEHARAESGASSVEYGLIVFAIAAMIVAIVFSLGVVNKEVFAESCDEIKGAVAASNASLACS